MTHAKLAVGAVLAALAALPAAARDWSGAYAGLTLGANLSGELRRYEGGTLDEVMGYDIGSAGSLIAGYNIQDGNMVYGGELAFSRLDVPLLGDPDIGLDQSGDLKIRVGFATGKALLYGVLGYSSVHIASATNEVDMAGMNYGFGVDYAINERYFIGAEYLVRDVSGTLYNEMFDTTYEFRSDNGILSLRLGMTF